MAGHDVKSDTVPALQYPNIMGGKFPTIAALKTAIAASGVSASYSAAAMNTMTKNDLIYVCRTNSIACVGI